MKQHIIIAAIALLFGIGLGTLLDDGAKSTSSTNEVTHVEPNVETDGHNSEEGDSHDHGHGHGGAMFMVDAANAPSVNVRVSEDAKSGWNVVVEATDFTFAPESVNGENVIGEGHAHLYVDDKKVARLYGPYFHYDENFDGAKEFRVTLNANDHSEYAVNGEVIEAVQQVVHMAHGEDEHSN